MPEQLPRQSYSHAAIERGARVLAAWDGRADAYDSDGEGELRAFYARRAEGVLRAAGESQEGEHDG
jgi:hypothetical protein